MTGVFSLMNKKTRIISIGVAIIILITGAFLMTSLLRPIPLEDFFRNPERTNYQLSPDGSHVAFLAPWNSRLNIHVQAVAENSSSRITYATARDIAGYIWKGNDHLIFVQDQGGDENFHLFIVGRDGKNQIELTPFEGVKVTIIDDLEDDPSHMLIGMNQRDSRIFDVYRINIYNGRYEMIAENPGNISGWYTDNDGKLRMAATEEDTSTSLLYRETENEPFRTIITTDFRSSISPQFFDFDNRNIYALSNIGRDRSAAVLIDPATGQELKVLFEHDQVDISGILRSKERKTVTGYTFHTSKRGFSFTDTLRADIQKKLEEKLPGYEVALADMSKDEKRMLVRTYSDRSRGAYYFYDLETEEFRKLGDISPWLDESDLCPTKPVSYTSRDGLTIQGYLTLPKDYDNNPLPVIINPHGGPWARDYWGFNSEVQFLANRGYAVLQMNFRGSTGYGRNFWELGFKQWGRAMQNDISDGVTWLINQKIADPDRIAIYGGSYGGYAVLAGLTFTPELYACGIDYVGVSNLFTFLETIPPYWELGRKMLYEMIGNPETEAELLKAASPLFHAENIRVPLLIAQGANDPRVKKAESDQMVEALRARGIQIEYIVKDDEGHGFRNEENRMEFYRAMERFLEKNL